VNLGKPRPPQTATEQALRKAFTLGQTYWQLADSNSTSNQNKSDKVKEQFEALVAQVLEGQKPVAHVMLEAWQSGAYWPDDCFFATPTKESVPLVLKDTI
jgi:hypothetical protein